MEKSIRLRTLAQDFQYEREVMEIDETADQEIADIIHKTVFAEDSEYLMARGHFK